MAEPTPSSPPAGPNAPAGWYPDPEGFGQQRYWDGTQWTDRFTTAAAQQTRATQSEDKSKALLIVGFVLAVLLPIGGVVVGIILLVRRQLAWGLAVILASVVVAVGLAAAFGLFDSSGEGRPRGATDAASLESDLPKALEGNGQGTIQDVQCVQRGDNVYRCLGEYEPSMRALREQYADYGVSERDLRKVQRQQTGEAALEVTVDDDGSYIYEFLQ